MTTTCRQGDYTVTLTKFGKRISTAGAKLTSVRYSRKLDAKGDATIVLNTSGPGCCGRLRQLRHWSCELVITAVNEAGDDEVVWRGPVLKPSFKKGIVTVDAVGLLAWLEKRKIDVDMTFPIQDNSDTFITIAEYAFNKDPLHPIEHTIVRYDSGVQEARQIDASSQRMAWSISQEMLGTGLDVTEFGSRIIVGVPPFKAYNLTDKQVIGDVEVLFDGDDFANGITVNASQDIVGHYPPGPPSGDENFPLVEALISDTQVPDQASADAAAMARWQFSADGVPRVVASGGLTLLPTSGINPRTLICGQLIDFAATETCIQASQVLRVGSVEVTVAAGKETATIELQPVGFELSDAA